jgi:hypothetical protein
MEDFQTSIELFLSKLKRYEGANPIFQIDYRNQFIIVTYAPGGFLRQLYADDRVLANLNEKGLHIEFLKN